MVLFRTQKQALEQQAAAQRTAMEEARRSKKLAQKYLQQTIAKFVASSRISVDGELSLLDRLGCVMRNEWKKMSVELKLRRKSKVC